MFQLQKTTSTVAEESLCDHSRGEITNQTMSSSCDKGDVNKDFIQAEELNVRIARRFVGGGFVFIAVAVSIAVFYFAKRSDERAFEDEVRQNATTTFHPLGIKM
jgi:lipoate-protein ligase A